MLTGLVSSESVEKILLFLFVNNECYGTQLKSLLDRPLTPIQKALQRLEKHEILYSTFEGKNRVYRINPSYRLRYELEMLLKKAYTLLSPQEKKRYCFLHKPRLSIEEEGKRESSRKKQLISFWEKLSQVKELQTSATLKEKEIPSTQSGRAEVTVTSPSPTTLVFQEKGSWISNQAPPTTFSNSFRWTLDINASLITLEHLRYGATHPVFLLHLTPTKPGLLESVDAHLCAQDTYLGNIEWDAHSIDFAWRIIGPHKNNQLLYRYT